ncbi:MAG TPA: sulfatase-like hydrolase/transferase [Stellaceae bacterium]|jgi:arylsulfatase A-like enzyme|nr:sulfatase-like hydrolase/transferase [Stellaceae bacterium]
MPATPPNIVFIMADDLGYADLSCCGRRDFSTPNIDRIAERGVRFTQAYANSAVCSATRLALITGRYQYRLPLGLEEPLAGKTDIGLPPEHPTLPSLLRAAGYRTALLGKWHLGVLPNFGPLKSGYESFWGIRSGAIDYYSHLNSRGTPDLWDGDEPTDRPGYLTDLLGDRAVETIERRTSAGEPFFLSLHFNAPHWPWEAPGDEAESQRLRGGNLRHYDGGTQRTYARMVQAMDRQVGRVLQALDTSGAAGNTIVIFTSDNGGGRFSDTWPFTGVKTELLEGGLRVPALVCWPERVPAGRTSDQVMVTMDWFPTLLEAAGAAPDPEYPADGISLLPGLADGAAPIPRKLFWRYKTNAQQALRDGDFKYLKIRDNTYLFDVVGDPRERANLKGRRTEIFDRLVAEWSAWNAAMLPEIPDSFGEVFTAADLADHIGS